MNLKSRCKNLEQVTGNTNEIACKNVPLGQIVDFNVDIQAVGCGNGLQTMVLKPIGLNQTLKLVSFNYSNVQRHRFMSIIIKESCFIMKQIKV